MMDRGDPLPDHVTASVGGVPYVPPRRDGEDAAGADHDTPSHPISPGDTGDAGDVARAFCVKCGVDVAVSGLDSECPRCGFDTVQHWIEQKTTPRSRIQIKETAGSRPGSSEHEAEAPHGMNFGGPHFLISRGATPAESLQLITREVRLTPLIACDPGCDCGFDEDPQ
jgi:hypothetical protein